MLPSFSIRSGLFFFGIQVESECVTYPLVKRARVWEREVSELELSFVKVGGRGGSSLRGKRRGEERKMDGRIERAGMCSIGGL